MSGIDGKAAPSGEASAPRFVEVVFDIPLDRRFTYRRDAKNGAAPGKRVMAPFGRREALGYVTAERDAPPEGIDPEGIKAIRRVVDKEAVFDRADLELAEWMAEYYLCGVGEALSAMIPSGRRVSSSPPSLPPEQDEPALELSAEQDRALKAIAGEALSGQEGGGKKKREMFYLYGITGSGKTEVFLRAAELVMRAGKSALYLVPEISLTHQAAESIRKRFGEAASAIHSGMTPGARLAEWGRIRRGEARIVVGPRSAVFAPLRNLGLIIVDEEQDGSYKSGNTPRYHARQVAMRRASLSGAVLVMGSATPSLEAWKLMRDDGMRRLDLSRRLAGGGAPEVRCVNLGRAEGCLTAELKEEIRATAAMGRQTILFLNRRGFAYFYHCRNCGYVLSCKHCSVSLTWHKSRGRAVCHYCGYSEPPPGACPGCGSLEAGFHGFGTEMIEEEVRRTFPALRTARVDTDTIAGKGTLEETLDRFRRGELDILLGTQMVAKGLNFPGVRLVGVVMADSGLHLPDFRAAERTFSLVVQVAGRAGRYFPDGKVIVQTFRPSDPAITRACALQVEEFYAGELAQRKALGFPPYARIIRFVIRARDEGGADRAISRLASISASLLPPDADLLGPSECPLAVIAGNHRRQIILRGRSMKSLHQAAGSILDRYSRGRDGRTYLEVDVDPASML